MQIATRDGRVLDADRRPGPTGAPVVVFESGNGASRWSWAAVTPRLADVTTVVYDRAGYGASPPDPGRRDLAKLRDDLVDLLDALGDGPFVLVGHSWGGPIVRAAAAEVPDRVIGLVLVDQTDEGCELFFGKGAERQVRWGARLLPLLVRLGVLRRVVRRLARSLPEPAATHMRATDGTAASVAVQFAELEHHVDDLRRLRDEPLALPDVPVTVISGGRTSLAERGRRPELVAAHRATAARYPKGRHVVATGSSHYVPFTEPEVVAAAVQRIVDDRRGR